MARKVIKVNLELDRIHCHDEGDGWGSAEPYLWTVFFKVDGNTVAVTESLTLSGTPTMHFTPGSHGNLGATDVDEGDDITIPAAIGEWETYLKPIPAPASLSALFEDLGGVVGVVAVLMEEDNVSDAGAAAGHTALNNAVRDAIQQIINTRSISNQDVTEAEINGFTTSIQNQVKNAIVNQQNFFENLWSALNPDDTIGVKVWLWSHDDIKDGGVFNFSHRWKSEGDWEIFGHLNSTPLCPANALSDFLKGKLKSGASASAAAASEMGSELDLEPMRQFRDGEYRNMPGLGRWFALAEQHTARLIPLMLVQPELRESARKMLEWGNLLAQEPDSPLSPEHAEHAAKLLRALSAHRNRKAGIDARRALAVLRVINGKTNREAMRFLSELAPARHPSVAGNRCARILPTHKTPDLKPKEETRCD